MQRSRRSAPCDESANIPKLVGSSEEAGSMQFERLRENTQLSGCSPAFARRDAPERA
jgi:hypothetical protein